MSIFKRLSVATNQAKTRVAEHLYDERLASLNEEAARLQKKSDLIDERENRVASKERSLNERETQLLRVARKPWLLLAATVSVSIAVVAGIASRYELVERKSTPTIGASGNAADSEPATEAKSPAIAPPSAHTNAEVARAAAIRQSHWGANLNDRNFDVGGHCLAIAKGGHVSFEECLKIVAAKGVSEGQIRINK